MPGTSRVFADCILAESPQVSCRPSSQPQLTTLKDSHRVSCCYDLQPSENAQHLLSPWCTLLP